MNERAGECERGDGQRIGREDAAAACGIAGLAPGAALRYRGAVFSCAMLPVRLVPSLVSFACLGLVVCRPAPSASTDAPSIASAEPEPVTKGHFVAAAAPADAAGGGSASVPGDAGETTGSLDKDVIRTIVRTDIDSVRDCYNEGLARDPKLTGRVEVQFVIGPSGEVTNSVLRTSTLPRAARAVEECIVAIPPRWRFPAPQGGGSVVVAYPFVLVPDDG